MEHRFACLAAAALALAADSRTLISTSSVGQPAGTVEIIVDGAPLRRYAHRGRWYVEATKSEEYSIRLRNPYAVRVAVALSVDGFNTIDARQTTAASARKWVLGPHETVMISGWQTSMAAARRFEFTTEDRSYGHALGRTDNMGLISAVFFRERAAAITSDRSTDRARGQSPQPQAGQAEEKASSPEARDSRVDEEYAATGMGQSIAHAVRRVRLDLEDVPSHAVDIRYEFRPQLVKLGILPSGHTADPLRRRERAQGFEPGFSPQPPQEP
jgi:hypothetical protein